MYSHPYPSDFLIWAVLRVSISCDWSTSNFTAAFFLSIIPVKGCLITLREVWDWFFWESTLTVVITYLLYPCVVLLECVFVWPTLQLTRHILISWWDTEPTDFCVFMLFCWPIQQFRQHRSLGRLWTFQITTLGRKIQRSATVTMIAALDDVIQGRLRKIQSNNCMKVSQMETFIAFIQLWRELFSIQGGALINAQPDLQALLAQLVSWNLVRAVDSLSWKAPECS